MTGSISVKASTGREVVVVSHALRARQRSQSEDTAGLHRLGQSSGLSVEEDNNVVTIIGGPFRAGDIDLQVPARTNLQLSTVNGRFIIVEDVEGDIETNAINGSVTLTDVSGAVVAHATNGKVRVTLKQVAAQKPLSFTSLNGTVDVTLPPTVRANLKLRSDRGEVYTDFDVKLQEKSQPVGSDFRSGYPMRIDTAILGTINGGGPECELRTFNGNIYLRKGK
jgi:hypothetical protein